MRTSEQINEIAAALAKAQGAIEGAKKDSLNPAFKSADKPKGSQYADLGAVWDACRGQLSTNGIAVVQSVAHQLVEGESATALRSYMVTRLVHGSGQWIEDGGVPLILSKQDMQGLGSAQTYARRYGLMSMVGIAPEDDDANAATGKTQAASTPTLEITAPAPTKPIEIPKGAVLLRKTEQHKTPKDKPYWLIVLSTGEELITWEEQMAAFAEQSCQNNEPVVITTKGGLWDGKPIARTILRPDQPKGPVKELSVAEIFNATVPVNERGF